MKSSTIITFALAVTALGIYQINTPITTLQLGDGQIACGRGATPRGCNNDCIAAIEKSLIPSKIISICAPTCESAGIFGYRRLIPRCKEICDRKYSGDIRVQCRAICLNVFNCGLPEDQ